VVAPHFLFSSRHDNCEHVRHVLVYFATSTETEGAHHPTSISLRALLCSLKKLGREGEEDQTHCSPCSHNMLSKLSEEIETLFSLRQDFFFGYLCDCKFMCVKSGCYEIAHTPPHFGRT
jgi:hypothetical protein